MPTGHNIQQLTNQKTMTITVYRFVYERDAKLMVRQWRGSYWTIGAWSYWVRYADDAPINARSHRVVAYLIAEMAVRDATRGWRRSPYDAMTGSPHAVAKLENVPVDLHDPAKVADYFKTYRA